LANCACCVVGGTSCSAVSRSAVEA
jgi:hypothetical protein